VSIFLVASPRPSNGTPFGEQLPMELCCIEDADEHEDKASPCAYYLNNPTLRLRREKSIVSSSAIAFIPKDVAPRVARPWHIWSSRPRRIAHLAWANIFQADILALATTEMPRTYDKYHHWLNVHHDGREEHGHGWRMHLPECASAHAFASPPNELHEVEHECHHDGDLQSVEKIDDASAGATVHHAGADLQ